MPQVIAHRGACRAAPANSLAAFEEAVVAGADMIELDVRRTLDGKYIVFHDDVLRGRPVSRFTYAEIQALRSQTRTRTLHGRLEGGFAPPLLSEVLERIQGRIGLDLELKETGYEAAICELVTPRFDRSQLVISSFHDGAVAAARRAAPDARLALLVGPGPRGTRARSEDVSPFNRAARCGADLIAPYHRYADRTLLTQAASRGVEVVVWTVNTRRRLSDMLSDSRIAAVITDVPDVAVALVTAMGGVAAST